MIASLHVDYKRLKDRDDAIHNGFEGRGGRNAYKSYSDTTRTVKANVPTYDGKIHDTTFSDCIVTIEDYFY